MRRSRKYSIAFIGEILGISHQQVQKYESGLNRIPVDKLHQLKNFYNVPYIMFFTGLDPVAAVQDEAGSRTEGLETYIAKMEESRLREKTIQIIRILGA